MIGCVGNLPGRPRSHVRADASRNHRRRRGHAAVARRGGVFGRDRDRAPRARPARARRPRRGDRQVSARCDRGCESRGSQASGDRATAWVLPRRDRRHFSRSSGRECRRAGRGAGADPRGDDAGPDRRSRKAPARTTVRLQPSAACPTRSQCATSAEALPRSSWGRATAVPRGHVRSTSGRYA